MGFTVFTLSLSTLYDRDRKKIQKKPMGLPFKWSSISYEDCKNYWRATDTIIALKTKEKVCVVDIENAGMEVWSDWVFNNTDSKTWVEDTGNKGMHYYFEPEPEFTQDITKIGGLEMDIICKGLIFAAPSYYNCSITGERKNYSWCDSPTDVKLQKMPTWLKTKLLQLTQGSSLKNGSSFDTTDKKKDISNVNMGKLSELLNNIFNTDYNWSYDGEKLYHGGRLCLVQDEHKHTDINHSCIFINNKGVMANCFSHGKKKLNKKKFRKVFKLLGIKPDVRNKDVLKKFNRKDYDCKLKTVLLENLTNTHEDVSRVLYELKKNNMVCVAEKPNVCWYEFNNGIWKETDGTSFLNKIISVDLFDLYLNVKQDGEEFINGDCNSGYFQDFYYKLKNNYTDEECMEVITEMFNVIDTIALKLKTKSYVDAVKSQCIHYFKDAGFVDRLDQNPRLLCFGKDVYDLSKCEWRETTKADMCSRKCGIDRKQVNDEYLEEVNEVFNNIFLDGEERQYVLNVLSDMLYGKNIKEKFYIWCGAGGNGKGIISAFLREALGDYYGEPPITLLTGKRSKAGQATPEMANLVGVRCSMFNEPQEGAKLNTSVVKNITGNDVISYRPLYREERSFIPQFTPCLQCNFGFRLQDVKDDSIPRRLVYIKFKTSFVDKDEIRFKWQREKDMTLKKKIEDLYTGSFMYLLIDTWNKLHTEYKGKVHNFKPPQSIIDETKGFVDESF
jgi:hypothetical protein